MLHLNIHTSEEENTSLASKITHFWANKRSLHRMNKLSLRFISRNVRDNVAGKKERGRRQRERRRNEVVGGATILGCSLNYRSVTCSNRKQRKGVKRLVSAVTRRPWNRVPRSVRRSLTDAFCYIPGELYLSDLTFSRQAQELANF